MYKSLTPKDCFGESEASARFNLDGPQMSNDLLARQFLFIRQIGVRWPQCWQELPLKPVSQLQWMPSFQ
jgi:hypothetical protein